MPCAPRVDYPGAWHHVMNRAARREALFGDDEHAGAFLAALAAAAERFEFEIHGYALMPNHYHLLVRSVRGNLSRAMKDVGGRFTQDVNRMRRWDGPVFRGRFHSRLIEDDDYLLTVAAYIHLNPIRAGLARRLDQHCWTSHRSYIGLDIPPQWLSWEFVTNLAGGQEAFTGFVSDLRTGAESWPPDFDLKTGAPSRVEQKERRVRTRPHLRDRKGRQARTGAAVLDAVLEIAGAHRRELTRSVQGRGGNPVRRFAAWALSQESNLTQVEIGALLGMSETHVSHVVRRMAASCREPLEEWMNIWRCRRRRAGA